MVNSGVNEKDLMIAIESSISKGETPRRERLTAIEQYVGCHYSDGGSEKGVPTNFLEMAVTIFTQQLAARAPRCTFVTKVNALKPFAYATEIALNQIPEEIGLADTLRSSVMEALFSFAVVKVGMCSSGAAVMGHETGEPFADLVDIDSYFCDMSVKTRAEMQFEGNDYWMPLAAAREMYAEHKKDLTADKYTNTDAAGNTRAQKVSVSEDMEVYRDKIWLRDVWITSTNKLLTYAVTSKKVLRIIDWDGPKGGPYHLLGFSDVPGNLLPLPPVSLWIDLHELGNNIFRKLGKQAVAKKTVATFQGGDDENVARLKEAEDGDGIKYTGGKPEALTVGGIDAPTMALFLQVKDLISYMAGNLDALGGLGPMSDTVGQDKMMTQSASARIDFMRSQVFAFIKNIFKSLAWYEWTDPVRKRTVDKPVNGTDISVRSVWSYETRDGDWLDYNFDIDAYSMQSDSPAEKLQKIGLIFEKYILPMLPQLQQQGGQINVKKLVSLISNLANIPELTDLVEFAEPIEGQPEQGNSEPTTGMPAHTSRTYNRTNTPGSSRHGKDAVLSQLMMGGDAQDAEKAALTRI